MADFSLLENLREFDAYRDEDPPIKTGVLPSVEPNYASEEVFERITPSLREALHKSGIPKLYEHQAQAILKALEPKTNIVLESPTASGKTLAFQVPVLNTLLKDKKSHALFIYPMNALSLDQQLQLRKLSMHLPEEEQIKSRQYVGHTPHAERQAIRKNPPPILITNPEMINSSLLGHNDKWVEFLKNLKWVVVDEMHEYRGYFGSHVSVLLRRFINLLNEKLDNYPQFFLSSATCNNAKEHAENLTGLSFHKIKVNEKMRPEREFCFIKPELPERKSWGSFQLQIVRAGLACLSEKKSVIVFCPTRNFTEDCRKKAIHEIKKHNKEIPGRFSENEIRVFKSGLKSKERLEIQDKIKSGKIRLIFSTNALELGIDIGRLDGIILAGFPDSLMSAWQRIGRAGRDWKNSAFVIYYARNNPLDQFYAENLEPFLDKPLDDLVINPGNESIIEHHLASLIYEMGTDVASYNEGTLGKPLYDTAIDKLKKGIKTQPRSFPQGEISLRGGKAGVFKLNCNGGEIGEMSDHHRFTEAYNGAIYMHGGISYRVEAISFESSKKSNKKSNSRGGTIILGEENTSNSTNPVITIKISDDKIFSGKQWHSSDSKMEISVIHGVTDMTRIIHTIQETNFHGEIIDSWAPNESLNKYQSKNAHSFWIAIKGLPPELQDGVMALQHILRIGAQFSVPVDTHDLYSHAEKDESLNEYTAYIIESYEGGIGVVTKVLEKWRSILEIGMGIAKKCACKDGCPYCIMPPRSKKGELSKTKGLEVANLLLENTKGEPSFISDGSFWEPNEA